MHPPPGRSEFVGGLVTRRAIGRLSSPRRLRAMAPKKVRGAKAKKGAAGKAANRGKGNARNNPRAFKAASGPTAMRLNAYRALEKQEKQYHVSLVDRSAEATVCSCVFAIRILLFHRVAHLNVAAS